MGRERQTDGHIILFGNLISKGHLIFQHAAYESWEWGLGMRLDVLLCLLACLYLCEGRKGERERDKHTKP